MKLGVKARMIQDIEAKIRAIETTRLIPYRSPNAPLGSEAKIPINVGAVNSNVYCIEVKWRSIIN